MPRKPDPEPANDPSDSFAQHKAARALLASSLAEYKDKLTPELENVLSAKALTIAQAEETVDLEKLDQLSIRIRSLEIREHALAQKTDASEKWLQSTLAVHIERDERLADYLDDQILAEALAELLKPFPEASRGELKVALAELAPKTTRYLEGRIKVPPYSYAWAQPLEPYSEKRPVLGIVDPLYAPPKREDTVKNLLAAVSNVLAVEQLLFERLKGDEQIPPFEKPAPPKSEDYLEWQKPLPGHQAFDSLSENLNIQVEVTAREMEERRERLKAG